VDPEGADRESNWVPTPKDEFSLYIRAYWPNAEILDGRWMPPHVRGGGATDWSNCKIVCKQFPLREGEYSIKSV
jgi:hypothetical protein